MSMVQEIAVLKQVANDDFATVVKIPFKNGDKVNAGDTVIELMNSKAVFVEAAEKAGYVQYLCQEQQEVAVGAVVVKIYETAGEIKAQQATDSGHLQTQTVFSKKALEFIEKEKLDKSIFAGKDFVGLEEVQALLKSAQAKPPVSGDIRLQKITKAKQLEIAALKEVQSANMNCVAAIFVETESLLQCARQYFKLFKNSILPFIITETAKLLPSYPEFNAYYAGEDIAFYNAVHIGLAMDLGQGLKVVKLSGMEKKDLSEVEETIVAMADKYLDKRLSIDDLTGSTFTITDLSSEGVAFFTPLISKNQSAILGVSAIDDRLNRCMLSLTFDHRVTEGKRAGALLNELKTRLESYGASTDTHGVNPSPDLHCSSCLVSMEEIKRQQGKGLLKIIDVHGEEKLLCETCFGGWQ